MTDKKKPKLWLIWLVIGLVLLSMLYVLSIGPAIRMFNQGNLSATLLSRIYSPILWLLQFLPTPVNEAWTWYQRLWLP